MVSTSMASTTLSRVAAENTGASRVLAAASRFTAMTSPTSAGAPVCVPLMVAILPAATELGLSRGRGGGNGGRCVGNSAGQGAWRTPVTTSRCGPVARSWPTRSTTPIATPTTSATSNCRSRSAPPATRPRRWPAPARCCSAVPSQTLRANLTQWVEPDRRGRHAGQPRQGHRAGHVDADESGGGSGDRAPTRRGSLSSPAPTWPARSPTNNPPPPSSPAPIPVGR